MARKKKSENRSIQPGDRFHRLTAVRYVESRRNYKAYYLFKCDCGAEKLIDGTSVSSGKTRSCGCLVKEARQRQRKPKHYAEISDIISSYRRHARIRGVKWGLSRRFVEIIVRQNCFYCDSKPSNVKKLTSTIGKGFKYSGMDRIDSNLGYTEQNVVPCCRFCNYAKHNLSVVKFRKWAIRLGKRAMSKSWDCITKE